LSQLSASQIIFGLRARHFSAVEVTRACLEAVERGDGAIRAWIHVSPELALKQAQAVDSKFRAGQVGRLAGVPVGVKDIFNTADMPTQMGSPIWKDFTPGNDARVVYSLRMADAVLLGKTVTAEFAVHAPGPTGNPHNPEYIPGTSSSGSAAATAAYMVPIALGTQTAGSIIRPASYCGVYGFKPSFGLVPRTGMLKTTDSLDTVGLFARTVEDVAILFDVIRVHGEDYPMSHGRLNDAARASGTKPWRVGLIRGPQWAHAEDYAQEALEQFGRKLGGIRGIRVEDLTLSDAFSRAHDIHATIYDRALAYYFKEEFAAETLVSPIMYEIVQRGNRLTLEQYKDALDEQRVLADHLDQLLADRFDVIVDLSTGGEALKGLDSTDRPDNCLIWTLCGVPALNLPVFTGPTGLPFGAQVFSRRYDDYLLLDFVRHLRAHGIVRDGTYPDPRSAE
jgi:Asp-tRNA(Asn)/Glu-tRNA(Gln) amidotransferase A subunit family amidase